jgi:ferrous iron transporter FeoB
MEDEARKRAIQINIKKLESFLGITVVFTTAIKNIGTEELVTSINKAFEGRSNEINLKRNYSPEINQTIRNIEKILRERNTANPGGEAEMILRGDEELLELIQLQSSIDVKDKIKKILNNAQSKFAKPLPLVLTETIDKEIAEVVRSSSMVGLRTRRSISEFLDDLTLNAFSGTLIFLSTLFLVFYFVGMIGAGEIVNFVESVIFGEYINPMLIQLVEALIPLSILQALLVGEYGVITFGLTYAVAIVFPVVTAFFIAFSILEDSGYLPRLAFLGDKLFRKIGLNGKAVLPLVLGTGCTTMATMTTRILETKKERLIATMALALGIPCSAQLAVIFGILTYVSPAGAVVVFGVVLSQLLLVTYLLHRLLPGEKSDFIMELPPLRVPQLRNITIKTWGRVEWFLKEAIPLFVIGTLFISFLNLFSLFEIVQYFLVFGVILLLWRKYINEKQTSITVFTKKYAYNMGVSFLIPVSFLFLYLSNISLFFIEILQNLMPMSNLLYSYTFLEVILEFTRPIMVTLLGLPPEASVMYILGFLRRDYGAAGFFDMATQGIINPNQIIVATIVLTLFVPCIANFFVIAKENGTKTAFAMVLFIIPFALFIGTVMNFLLVMGGLTF